jgi:hypothetical protein
MTAYTTFSHQSLLLTTLLHVVLLRSLVQLNSAIILNRHKIHVNTVVKFMHELRIKICCSVQLYRLFSKKILKLIFARNVLYIFRYNDVNPPVCYALPIYTTSSASLSHFRFKSLWPVVFCYTQHLFPTGIPLLIYAFMINAHFFRRATRA